ncbi:protein-lysine N-methyltransferase CG9154 [Anopheles bellator]|uniref:protein-lysine N-methyltransferase CG9154 n=1 Tax=Anopheles bellator TaxID=139047 RepID=UPI00264877AB|nr:protein-lysine N-methyltransferase CG9154 [Anopheles bellator]
MASTESNAIENIDDGEPCVLREDTMLILQQFLKEKELKESMETESSELNKRFEENWQLSQFWYNESTKEKLASVVEHLQKEKPTSEGKFKVALLSAPSAFKHISIVVPDAMLFEYDGRFAFYGEHFRQYDYNRAFEPQYLDEFRHTFDLIIADPPFLSEECIQKIAFIVKKMSKSHGKLVLCSGAVVQSWAQQYLAVKLCQFRPEHERNLGNEFCSYANFDLDSLLNKANP